MRLSTVSWLPMHQPARCADTNWRVVVLLVELVLVVFPLVAQ